MPRRAAAAPRERPPVAAKAKVASLALSSTPTSTGPKSVASDSSRPRTTLELVSCGAVVQNDGSSAEWVGQNTVEPMVAGTASA